MGKVLCEGPEAADCIRSQEADNGAWQLTFSFFIQPRMASLGTVSSMFDVVIATSVNPA